MIGKPKFKIGDQVTFTLEKLGTIKGNIYIIDPYGTFEDDSDVSYDIMGMYKDQETLFKHIPERLVSTK